MFEGFFEIFDWNLKGRIQLRYPLIFIMLLFDLTFGGLFAVHVLVTNFHQQL